MASLSRRTSPGSAHPFRRAFRGIVVIDRKGLTRTRNSWNRRRARREAQLAATFEKLKATGIKQVPVQTVGQPTP